MTQPGPSSILDNMLKEDPYLEAADMLLAAIDVADTARKKIRGVMLDATDVIEEIVDDLTPVFADEFDVLDKSGKPDGGAQFRLLTAEALMSLESLKTAVKELYELYERLGISVIGDDPVALEGGPFAVEVRTGTPRKAWHHREIGKVVAHRLSEMAIDRDTGEVLKTPEEIALEMLQFVGASYWKVKALSKIGVDPDKYCEVKDPKSRIAFIDTTK